MRSENADQQIVVNMRSAKTRTCSTYDIKELDRDKHAHAKGIR